MDGNMYATSDGGAFGGMMMMLFFFAAYFYVAFAQMKIAQKVNHENPWFAFIPILNVVQLIQMAQKPMWWLLLLFVPLVNIVCLAALWMGVAKRIGHSPVVGFFTIVPVISFFTLGVMAFGSGNGGSGNMPPRTPSQPRQPAGVA
ncbi:MAG: hypothetical protein D6800_00545 [Candidatus Zixiibacteriota bacterium]|nr:MAG: hypothetical protein D6800_00545 [candidate division Zixibacteria bacterium]